MIKVIDVEILGRSLTTARVMCMQVGDFLFVEKRKFGLIDSTIDLDRPKRLAELERCSINVESMSR
jgi:hypothetical protein